MSKLKQDFLVGSIFFAGIILIGIFTIVVKDISLLQGQKGQISILFNRINGLEKGHKVLASGMEVGQVSDMELREDGTVKVAINLTKQIKLYKDYKIAVKDASALGGKYVDVEIGTPTAGVIPMGYEDKLKPEEENLKPLDGTVTNSILDDPNLRDIFSSLKKIVKNLEEGKGTIGLLLTEREIYDNIREASRNIKEVTSQLKNKEGTIGKLLYDKELHEQISRIATNIEKITGTISKGEGTIGKLVVDDTVYNDLKKVMENATRVSENLTQITDKVKKGEGTVGKLFTDEKVYNNLDSALTDARTMMKNINEVVQNINTGKGTLGKLVKDETMAQDLKDALSNIKTVTERLKKGEGTVGKLLADDTLYQEIRRVVKGFSDSLEDTREQVPISTFSSLLFKAF